MGNATHFESEYSPEQSPAHGAYYYSPGPLSLAARPAPVPRAASDSNAMSAHSYPTSQYAPYAPPSVPGDALSKSQRASDAGPSKRMSSSGQIHRREPSSAGASAPYQRPEGASYNAKASSTTSLFTTRKNWSEHIIQEMQDFMHVLSPTGSFVYATPCIRDLASYSPDELFGQSIFDYIHPDDVDAVRRDFTEAGKTHEALSLYYRFRTKAGPYLLFEVTGHWYYGKKASTSTKEGGGTELAKCFFAMARPYPSKNAAMLDSFLELKFENERLRQELLVMYKDIEGDSQPATAFPPGVYRVEAFESGASSVVDPATGLVQTQTLIPSSSNTYGALGIGISANGTKGDGTGEKKKKARPDEGEFVCRDCGTVDSPEWRKGPDGPKSLCNACGLRYAKLVSKTKKAEASQK